MPFARDAKAASWLSLCGEEFAAVEGGMLYASVQAAVSESANVYAGLRAGASADQVLARAEADDAPFAGSDELRAWVALPKRTTHPSQAPTSSGRGSRKTRRNRLSPFAAPLASIGGPGVTHHN
jgi:hypothetical protein